MFPFMVVLWLLARYMAGVLFMDFMESSINRLPLSLRLIVLIFGLIFFLILAGLLYECITRRQHNMNRRNSDSNGGGPDGGPGGPGGPGSALVLASALSSEPAAPASPQIRQRFPFNCSEDCNSPNLGPVQEGRLVCRRCPATTDTVVPIATATAIDRDITTPMMTMAARNDDGNTDSASTDPFPYGEDIRFGPYSPNTERRFVLRCRQGTIVSTEDEDDLHLEDAMRDRYPSLPPVYRHNAVIQSLIDRDGFLYDNSSASLRGFRTLEEIIYGDSDDEIDPFLEVWAAAREAGDINDGTPPPFQYCNMGRRYYQMNLD